MRFQLRHCILIALLASGACVGNIDSSEPASGTSDSVSTGGPGRDWVATDGQGGQGGRAGSAGKVASPGAAAPAPGPGCTTGDPGASPLRPLTRDEYHRTIVDLTGIDLQKLAVLAPPAVVSGFATDRENFPLSAVQVHSFMEGAEVVARAVAAAPERRAQVIGCDPAAAACLRTFVTRFGRRAFRRTLQPDELSALVTLAQSAQDDPDPYAGVGLVMRAVLQSPKFLLLIEQGEPDPTRGGRRRLTGPERAARLSYLLLGTTPDDALLATAEGGGLDQAVKMEEVARRLLGDPRARAHLRSFFSQWLGLHALGGVSRDAKAYPLWNDALRASMESETLRLLEDFAWTQGRSFIDVLGARHTFVDAPLARLYGLPAPSSNFQKVTLEGGPRVGLLTQPSLLTTTAGGDATPIRRGKFIREVLLCRPPPDPPNNVPDLPAAAPGQTPRERLQLHRTSPACAGCHALLDPLGFGLARFDEIGAYRELDPSGKTISDDGEFIDVDLPAFRGPVELAAKIRATGAFPRCLAEKVLEYGLGRRITDADSCIARPLEESFARQGHDLSALLRALVTSDAFLYRQVANSNSAPGGKP